MKFLAVKSSFVLKSACLILYVWNHYIFVILLSRYLRFVLPCCRNPCDGSYCRESGIDVLLSSTGLPLTLNTHTLFALRRCSLFELGQPTDLPECVVDGLQQLSEVVSTYLQYCPSTIGWCSWGWMDCVGRPRLNIESQTLLNLLNTGLPLTSLTDLHGIITFLLGTTLWFLEHLIAFFFFQSLIHNLSCELLHKFPTLLQIFYLDTAGNNKVETAFGFFMNGVRINGRPSRQAQ